MSRLAVGVFSCHRNKCNLRLLVLFVVFSLHLVDGQDSAAAKGPPSPPRNLRRSVLGFEPNREYRIFWLASFDTGGLPVNYSIRLCLNDSVMPVYHPCVWSKSPECNPTNIRSNLKDFYCLLNDDDEVPLFRKIAYNYALYVIAKNAKGNASSSMFLPRVSYNSVTLRPPQSLRAEAQGTKEIYISWLARKDWILMFLEYAIVYQAENGANKTKVINSKQNYTLLTKDDGLRAFMNYYIYVMVRLINNQGKPGDYSALAGPVKVRTKAGEPSPPPVVLNHTSVVFPGNSALRNVTVEWQLSNDSSWLGTPHEYTFECSRHQQLVPNACMNRVNATFNTTVLQNLNSSDSYLVYMRMRNKEGRRSAVGHSYTIPPVEPINRVEPGPKTSNIRQIALVASAGALFGILLCIGIVLCRKWRHHRRPEQILRDLVVVPPPVDDYREAEPFIQREYDRLNLDAQDV